MSENEPDLIVVDPKICAGKPVVRGTRVPVEYLVHLREKATPRNGLRKSSTSMKNS
ncbi:MAG: DUF433 domain-containing protein [archaeon]|nr:DUF433 domain-containing protein [archaeon]